MKLLELSASEKLQQINLCLYSFAQARRQSLERLQTKLLGSASSKYNTTLFMSALNQSQLCNIELCKYLYIYITALHRLHLITEFQLSQRNNCATVAFYIAESHTSLPGMKFKSKLGVKNATQLIDEFSEKM